MQDTTLTMVTKQTTMFTMYPDGALTSVIRPHIWIPSFRIMLDIW